MHRRPICLSYVFKVPSFYSGASTGASRGSETGKQYHLLEGDLGKSALFSAKLGNAVPYGRFKSQDNYPVCVHAVVAFAITHLCNCGSYSTAIRDCESPIPKPCDGFAKIRPIFCNTILHALHSEN